MGIRAAMSPRNELVAQLNALLRLTQTETMIAEQPKRIIGLAAIRMLLHTGMRKGEVLTLDWSMIDIDHRVIHLPKDKASDTGRDVLLTHAAIDVLRSLPKMARGGCPGAVIRNSSTWFVRV